MKHIINFSIVARILSRNLFVIGIAMLSCIAVALIYAEDVLPFVYSSLLTLGLGGTLFLLSRRFRTDTQIHKKDTYFTVSLSWIVIGLVGSLPFIFSKSIPSFIDAYFESISGFSTTGASILTDIEVLPKSVLFWRSLTHWVGGLGIIVLVILIMPSLKMGGYNLFTLESSLQEKIKPRIRAVGARLLRIYVGLTVAEIILLMLGNMNLFESVCHAFGTIATGGFSPKNTSIMDYSPYIQYVIMIFMVLAGTNFLMHYYLLKGEFSKVRMNEEFKFYLFMIFIIGGIISGTLFFRMHKPLELSVREGYFQVISIITCTGFATADYLKWPQFGWMLIFFAMFLGGSTGSTAGGIKMARYVILFKNIRNIIRQAISPHAVVPLRLNHNVVSSEANNTILTFITVYIFIFFIGTTLMALMGLDIETAGSSVATCMAGIGPGIGTVGPAGNFAHLPGAGKILLALMMIIGRLEIFTIIVLFSPAFWKR